MQQDLFLVEIEGIIRSVKGDKELAALIFKFDSQKNFLLVLLLASEGKVSGHFFAHRSASVSIETDDLLLLPLRYQGFRKSHSAVARERPNSFVLPFTLDLVDDGRKSYCEGAKGLDSRCVLISAALVDP